MGQRKARGTLGVTLYSCTENICLHGAGAISHALVRLLSLWMAKQKYIVKKFGGLEISERQRHQIGGGAWLRCMQYALKDGLSYLPLYPS